MTNSQKHLGWNLETKGSGKMGGGVCSSQDELAILIKFISCLTPESNFFI